MGGDSDVWRERLRKRPLRTAITPEFRSRACSPTATPDLTSIRSAEADHDRVFSSSTSRSRRATTLSSPGCIIQTPMTRALPSARVPIDGSPSRALDGFRRRDPSGGGVPRDPQVGNMVGDLGHEDLCRHAGDGGGAAADRLGAFFEFTQFGRVIERQVALQRRQHADHFLLVHLQAAPDGIAVGRRVQAGGRDEVFSANQQSGALRSAEAFAARRTPRDRNPSSCTSTDSRPAARRRRRR